MKKCNKPKLSKNQLAKIGQCQVMLMEQIQQTQEAVEEKQQYTDDAELLADVSVQQQDPENFEDDLGQDPNEEFSAEGHEVDNEIASDHQFGPYRGKNSRNSNEQKLAAAPETAPQDQEEFKKYMNPMTQQHQSHAHQ